MSNVNIAYLMDQARRLYDDPKQWTSICQETIGVCLKLDDQSIIDVLNSLLNYCPDKNDVDEILFQIAQLLAVFTLFWAPGPNEVSVVWKLCDFLREKNWKEVDELYKDERNHIGLKRYWEIVGEIKPI